MSVDDLDEIHEQTIANLWNLIRETAAEAPELDPEESD